MSETAAFDTVCDPTKVYKMRSDDGICYILTVGLSPLLTLREGLSGARLSCSPEPVQNYQEKEWYDQIDLATCRIEKRLDSSPIRRPLLSLMEQRVLLGL